MFYRRLPHQGLKGSENEKALADVLRDFLPVKYGIEQNALLIDRDGAVSRQCDIVIYDNVQFPNYFRKVYPVEIVHAVLEVKTELSKQQVDDALENENAVRDLRCLPALTPYWQTRTREEQIPHKPLLHGVFGYRSSSEDFGTFMRWFSTLPTSTISNNDFAYYPPFNPFIACSLDKGILFCRGDSHISRWLAVAEDSDNERSFAVLANGNRLTVDPAKALFFFLETLWTMLEQSPRHPGFDIRSYMDHDLNSYVSFDDDGRVEGL